MVSSRFLKGSIEAGGDTLTKSTGGSTTTTTDDPATTDAGTTVGYPPSSGWGTGGLISTCKKSTISPAKRSTIQ